MPPVPEAAGSVDVTCTIKEALATYSSCEGRGRFLYAEVLHVDFLHAIDLSPKPARRLEARVAAPEPASPAPATVSVDDSPAESRSTITIVDIVGGVTSGSIDPLDPCAASLGMPTTLAELECVGGTEAVIRDCFALLRTDFPLLALRRLLRLGALLDQHPAPPQVPLREMADPRVAEILASGDEMHSTLETMMFSEWDLYATKKKLDLRISTRPAGGGRLNVKVEGELPRGLASCLAPLLHPELYKQWIPLISLSETIADASPFRKFAYLRAQSLPASPPRRRSNPHAEPRTRAHTRAHARTRAHTRAHDPAPTRPRACARARPRARAHAHAHAGP